MSEIPKSNTPASVLTEAEKIERLGKIINGYNHPETIHADKYLQLRHSRINNHMANSGIPHEFYNYSIIPTSEKLKYNYTETNGAIIESRKKAYDAVINYLKPENLSSNIKNGKGVFIYGEQKSNLGISLLCTFLLRGCIEHDCRGRYVSFVALCDELFATFDGLSEYSTVPVLMIDTITIGAEIKESLRGRLSNLLKTRADNGLVTFFASHVSFNTFMERIDESLIYSYGQTCEIIEINKTSSITASNAVDVSKYIADVKKRFAAQPWVSMERLEAHLKEFGRRR